MSHFSKIQTNISKIDQLKLALKDLDCYCQLDDHTSRLYIYNKEHSCKDFICYFDWDGYSYSLVADIILWNCSINFEVFLEKLHQNYAFHTILNQSQYNGFTEAAYDALPDGSIKLVMEKWSSVYS